MLWDLVKHLKEAAPIYKDVMNEQESNIPQTYVVIEEDVYDDNLNSGDGLSLIRRSSYNIRIHSRTAAEARTIAQPYREVLMTNRLGFEQFGPTFDPGTSYYSILISGRYTYGI
jgi:hypothetical protein